MERAPSVQVPFATRCSPTCHCSLRILMSYPNYRGFHMCSDFHSLREFLCARYVGMLVPALPDKVALNKKDPGVIRDRIRGLGLFLDRALANPYLRCDTQFVQFLSGTDCPDYDKLKVGVLGKMKRGWCDMGVCMLAQETEKAGVADGDNTGMTRWRAAITRYRLPFDADK